MPGILVTDGMQRKSLAAVRALGAAGERVVAAEWTALAGALFSKYAGRARLPHPREGGEALARAVAALCRSRGLDVVLPMEESTLLALLRNVRLLPGGVRLPFPSLEQVEEARDKERILRRAAALGIPIPRTAVLADAATERSREREREWESGGEDGRPIPPSAHPRFSPSSTAGCAPPLPPFSPSPLRAPVGAQLEELDAPALGAFPLPALVKPRISSGAVGLRYADTPEALLAAAEEVARRFPRPLVQERLPREGEGIGVSVLMGEGERVHAIFSHRRLREYPVSGGASTLRESIRHPAAEDAAVRLLADLRWRGVAMVEFKRDPRDGVAKLLELNPRFWGSLALPFKAGVNFPHLLVKWARGEKLGGPPRYRLGVRCRWSLPGDFLHFWKSPDRFRMDPPVWKFHGRDLHDDIWDPTDPWPVLGTLLSLLPFLLDPDLRRFLHR